MKNRRAKRISDRKNKSEISEEQKPFLTLVSEVIVQIILQLLEEEDDQNSFEFQEKPRYQNV